MKSIWQATPLLFASRGIFYVEGMPPGPPNAALGGGAVLAGKFLLSAHHVGVPRLGSMAMTPSGMRFMLYGEKIAEERLLHFNHHTTGEMKIIYQNAANDVVLFELSEECRSCTIPVPIGFSKDLGVGDTLMMIGNALNDGLSLRLGAVSAFNPYDMAPLAIPPSYVVTADISICPGDSGYPVYALTTEDSFVLAGYAVAHTASCQKGIFILIDSVLADIQKELNIDLRALHNAYISPRPFP